MLGGELSLHLLSAREIAQVFSCNEEKALWIKKQWITSMDTPFEEIYRSKNYETILFDDFYYPSEFFHLYDPPSLFYVAGNLKFLKQPKIAIIGSRNASYYSKRALQQIVPPLVMHKLAIVSGFAKGADTFAFRATMLYGGKAIAILGSGFDHIYPKENCDLFHNYVQKACFVSEFPPHVGPKKWHFPMRNRLISALSDALIVTEAAERSGTLITTDFALELGKDVFAVPGPIDSDLSKGTNQLILEGAIPIWNGYQVIEQIKINRMLQ